MAGAGPGSGSCSWEHTVQSLRDLRASLLALEARQRYLALGGERSCRALVTTGSMAGREAEVAALAEELGFSQEGPSRPLLTVN
jgi:hypothetical protein